MKSARARKRAPQTRRPGAHLDLVMVVVGAEESEEVDSAHDREHNPAGQDDRGIEPRVLRRDVGELRRIEET